MTVYFKWNCQSRHFKYAKANWFHLIGISARCFCKSSRGVCSFMYIPRVCSYGLLLQPLHCGVKKLNRLFQTVWNVRIFSHKNATPSRCEYFRKLARRREIIHDFTWKVFYVTFCSKLISIQKVYKAVPAWKAFLPGPLRSLKSSSCEQNVIFFICFPFPYRGELSMLAVDATGARRCS